MGREEQEEAAVGYPVHHQHTHYYTQLPDSASDSPPPVLVVRRRRSRICRSLGISLVVFLWIAALGSVAVLVLWPREVRIDVRCAELVSMSWSKKADATENNLEVGLDMNFKLLLRLKNPNVIGVKYSRIEVQLGYREDELGKVVLQGGRVPALSITDVDAVLDLKGVKVLKNAAWLLLDIAEGRLRLETDTDFDGNVEFWVIKPHVQAKVNCDIIVNPLTEEVLKQSCLLED